MKTQYITKNEYGTFYYSDKEMTKLHREDGPACELSDGTKFWHLNGKYHRVDGPAIEYPNGYKEWCSNGLLHREDGPAIEYPSGSKSWYLNGDLLTEAEFGQRTAKRELTLDEIAAKFNVNPKNIKIKK